MLVQAEALRGDQEGFARQQEVLDTAQKLVAHAQAQVAAMEANTPSLEQVKRLTAFSTMSSNMYSTSRCAYEKLDTVWRCFKPCQGARATHPQQPSCLQTNARST